MATFSYRKFLGILCETTQEVNKLIKYHDYNFRLYKGKQSVQKIARNLVDYEAGKTILETAIGIENNNNKQQTKLF